VLPSGAGLLAGTVHLSATGQIVALDPSPSPFYTPEPGDADLPVIPGTTIVVTSPTAPTSSDLGVLAPVAPVSGATGFTFRAGTSGCAILTGPGLHLTVGVRSPTS
jgi:hypothetical protein